MNADTQSPTLSRRQLLAQTGAAALLPVPAIHSLAGLLIAPNALVFRIERDKRGKPWDLTESTEDDFVELIRYQVATNEVWMGQKRWRAGVRFDFRGYEAEPPLRRRVKLVAMLLDNTGHPIIMSDSVQFLDRRRVARESVNEPNPWMASRGRVSSRLATSFNFRPELYDRVAAIEFWFVELEPLEKLPNNPWE